MNLEQFSEDLLAVIQEAVQPTHLPLGLRQRPPRGKVPCQIGALVAMERNVIIGRSYFQRVRMASR